MEIRSYGFSTAGRRPENEDAYLHKVFKRSRGCLHAVVAICDGMGGQSGGSIASRLAIDEIDKAVKSPPLNNKAIRSWITHTTESIQKRLIAYCVTHPELSDMGTTLVLAAVSEESVWIANIGDSRAYQIDELSTTQLTVDHTAIQDGIDRGIYTLENVSSSAELRSLATALVRNLGEGGNSQPDIIEIPLSYSQVYLLCSDGLVGSMVNPLVFDHDMENHIFGTTDLETATDNLISIAYQRGSTDNITIVLIEIGNLPRRSILLPDETDIDVMRSRDFTTVIPAKRRLKRRSNTFLILNLIVAVILIAAIVIVIDRENIFPQREPANDMLATESPVSADTGTDGILISKTESTHDEEPDRVDGAELSSAVKPSEADNLNSVESAQDTIVFKLGDAWPGSTNVILLVTRIPIGTSNLSDAQWELQLIVRMGDKEYQSNIEKINTTE
ncbi:hypothetical protein CEE37_14435 [candidate division LCP-89 bacterium B3_LCP]|uniref:PPM-type phosphatase domain-containing protein n=1 Tax=candidate division LCP-89 bacterium B3_LCP TaxID=2012998 RepID=A0A532UPQ0_UNCL8|nr:MAG: hypothetical protein CEE37_14435 [candidate division LCP-89 bacterium B3_LCP]